jgi:peptide/nickel transport system permease protein
MIRHLVRRVALALLLVWAVASAAFVLVRLAPGDATLDERWGRGVEAREAARRELGLDRPLVEQYVRWVGGALALDFGESSLYGRPVASLLGERLMNTAMLATAALLLAALVGVPAGIYTATRAGTWGARLARGVSVLFVSTPPLVGSLVLVLIAARTGWLPVGGISSGTSASWLGASLDLLAHLVVPATALALPLAATLERVQSQALAETLARPFVGASRARGVAAGVAITRHAWPVSLGPVLALYGLMIGALFSGSFAVEVVTAWPGLGRLMVDGLRARDLALVAGTAAAGAACLAVGTLVGDLVHAALDPRVRGLGPEAWGVGLGPRRSGLRA